MAFRRSITARAKLLCQQQRFAPSFSYLHSENDRDNQSSVSRESSISSLLGCGINGSNSPFFDRRYSRHYAIPMSSGLLFARNMSTGVGEGADKIEYMADVAEVLTDKAVEAVASQAPVVNEVAIAAADSFFPVAGLQYLIDYVHTLTGFDWWASIVATTIVIRWLTLPLMINQLKATSKMTLLRPRLEEVNEEMQRRGMSPVAVAEGQQQMKQLFKEYGVSPFTPLKGLLIQGPIFVSFFLAIQNMVQKVPSFQQGGAFWFVDLTTPDSMYIFPVLTALTFWITVECNAQEGLEGNPAGRTIKNVSRVFAAVTIPFTAGFPKAIFCYWITSNLFSLMYGLAIKNHKVKNLLGIPIIPVTPPSTTQKPGLSFFDAIKKYAAAQQQAQQSVSSPTGAPKPASQRIPSSAVLSQRIKSLEKEVKGRKKGKKR